MRARFYPDEVRTEAVRLVVKHRLTVGEAALQLGLRSEVVRVWVRRFRCMRGAASDVDQLRARLQKIAMERDVLANIATRLLDKTG
ncbi:transposase [Rhodanobacter geophilus]|uniref:Transposase n=1 Tax=Rhodanobacter geophilus TaxID=3162488 RepID=A0ABV3QPM4_9GAMM